MFAAQSWGETVLDDARRINGPKTPDAVGAIQRCGRCDCCVIFEAAAWRIVVGMTIASGTGCTLFVIEFALTVQRKWCVDEHEASYLIQRYAVCAWNHCLWIRILEIAALWRSSNQHHRNIATSGPNTKNEEKISPEWRILHVGQCHWRLHSLHTPQNRCAYAIRNSSFSQTIYSYCTITLYKCTCCRRVYTQIQQQSIGRSLFPANGNVAERRSVV